MYIFSKILMVGFGVMGQIGSFACFGITLECAASKCANARWHALSARHCV